MVVYVILFLWLIYVRVVYVSINIFCYGVSCINIRVGFVFWIIDNSVCVLVSMFEVDCVKIGDDVYCVCYVELSRVEVMCKCLFNIWVFRYI